MVDEGAARLPAARPADLPGSHETLDPKQTIHDFVIEPLLVNGIGASAADRRPGRRGAGISGLGRRRTSPSGTARAVGRTAAARGHRGSARPGPELVVADEPVSMLDVSIRTELLRLMLDLRTERN